jgi:hypothetical protein
MCPIASPRSIVRAWRDSYVRGARPLEQNPARTAGFAGPKGSWFGELNRCRYSRLLQPAWFHNIHDNPRNLGHPWFPAA